VIVIVSGVGLATIFKKVTFQRRNFTEYVGRRRRAVPARSDGTARNNNNNNHHHHRRRRHYYAKESIRRYKSGR